MYTNITYVASVLRTLLTRLVGNTVYVLEFDIIYPAGTETKLQAG